MGSIIEDVKEALKFNGIRVYDYKDRIFRTDHGWYRFYKAKYRFHETKETNIPFGVYRKIPDRVENFILWYGGNLFILPKESVIKAPRLLGGKKVLPISETSLIPLRKPIKIAKAKRFTHLHVHSSYCLSGDTLVYNCMSNGPNTRSDWTCLGSCKTLEYLYTNFAGLHPKGRNYVENYRVKVFDGDKFVASRILDVRFSGKKRMCELTTESGKKIKASSKHRFWTKDGWRRVWQLKIGNEMGCNGTLSVVRTPAITSEEDARSLLYNKEWLRKKIYLDGLRHSEIAGFLGLARSTVSLKVQRFGLSMDREEVGRRAAATYARKHAHKRIANLKLLEGITPNCCRHRARITLKDRCERCGIGKDEVRSRMGLIVHHKDGNPYNNRPSNLITLCQKCHRIEHSPWPYTVKYERLVSIKRLGFEDTYDLEVEHSAHNFVANGFITHNSALDGVSSCRQLVEKAASLGMDAMAITDHGNISGHMDFYLRCNAAGIKPIFGCEEYFVGDATIKDGDHRKSFHIVLLVKNEEGYRNLLRLQKLSWSPEHFYYRPRIDWGMLERYSGGLICLTACAKGLLNRYILAKKRKTALSKAKKLKAIFGEDLYLELQLINLVGDDGIDLQKVANEGLVRISRKLDIPTVITSDVHYINKGMHEVQDMVCKIHQDTEMYSTECTDNWLKTYEELIDTWREKCPYLKARRVKASLRITQEIAEKCNYEIPTGKAYFPKYDHKHHVMYKKWGKKLTKEKFFRKLTRVSAKKKKLWGKPEYRERIDYEIDAFTKTNSVDYLLIVDDLVRYMRKQGCLSHMRGSANGSLVCYLLGLGIVDPVRYNIMFERFISPGRILQGLTDIDIDLDFEAEYRDVAIRYLKRRYGADHICSVGSFSRLQLKNAIKSLTRVEADKIRKRIKESEDKEEVKRLEKELEPFTFQAINKVTKSMWGTGEDALESSDDASEWYRKNKEWFDTFVQPIIGNVYAASIHPAGVVICPRPYDDFIPVRTQKEKGSDDRVFTTQWENSHTYEEFLNERGVMILDVLGVNALSIISRTIKEINKRHGTRLKLEDIPTDDPKVYETLSEGENLGYFQLGKPALKSMLRDLKPDRIDDLIFLSAADRPGALAAQAHVRYIKRKHGEEKVKHYHPSLKSVLDDTYGVIVYSEHIMGTAIEFAGMSIVDAEELRKIIKAKDPKRFAVFKKKFMSGARKKWGKSVVCKQKGQDQSLAERVWETFRASATYLFPRGHSTAYALYGNATQWLKIHYPLEFFKNYLSYADDTDYPAIMSVAKQYYGVKFINPTVNFSKEDFIIRKGKIQWSICSIKNVGQRAAQSIESCQPFKSLEDFYERIDRRVCNVKVVTSLIASGAFRKFGDRGTLIEKYFSLKKQSVPDAYTDLTEIDWQMERSKVITYGEQSIRQLYKDKIKRMDSHSQFLKAGTGTRVVVLGKVTRRSEITTKQNKSMWMLTLEDAGDVYPIIFWSEFLKKLNRKGLNGQIDKEAVLLVSGYKGKSPKGEHQLALGSEAGSYVKVLRSSG